MNLKEAEHKTKMWASGEYVYFPYKEQWDFAISKENKKDKKHIYARRTLANYRTKPASLVQRIESAIQNAKLANDNLYRLQGIWHKLIIED